MGYVSDCEKNEDDISGFVTLYLWLLACLTGKKSDVAYPRGGGAAGLAHSLAVVCCFVQLLCACTQTTFSLYNSCICSNPPRNHSGLEKCCNVRRFQNSALFLSGLALYPDELQ